MGSGITLKLKENNEKRTCELRRLSSRNSSIMHRTGSISNKTNRITRIISENNLTESCNGKENNGDSAFDSIYILNNSSTPSLVKIPFQNSFNKTDSIETESYHKNLKQSTTDDLDEYASNNQASFTRRISIRKNRKLPHSTEKRQSFNNVYVNSSSFLGAGSNIQPSQTASESNFLLSFLNNGLEHNREISSNRNGIFINIGDSSESQNNLESKNKIECQESTDKKNCDDLYYEDNTNVENEFDNFDTSKPVTLRRSQSTTEVDMLNSKLQKRREIISAIVLTEEKEKQNGASQHEINNPKKASCPNDNGIITIDSQISADTTVNNANNSNFTQLQRCQSRSSNRLSGLKKLESLYKAFKDDDDDFFSNQKSNRKCELK